jgi:hypothetical protein
MEHAPMFHGEPAFGALTDWQGSDRLKAPCDLVISMKELSERKRSEALSLRELRSF